MYEGTSLWERLAPARRLLEEILDDERLYQVRESAKITYQRHILPTALEPTRQNIEDALPLFIMYASNASENAAAVDPAVRRRLAEIVYGAFSSLLAERREPVSSPIARGVTLLSSIDSGHYRLPSDLGAYYSLLFAVLVVAQIYVSGAPVMRMSLYPLYGLERASLQRLQDAT
jgi:hypothetical protein